MTPQEKAIELYDKYLPYVNVKNFFGDNIDHQNTKQCALIVIEEILNYHDSLFELGLKNVHQTFTTPTEMYNDVMNPAKKYLQQVKEEITKL